MVVPKEHSKSKGPKRIEYRITPKGREHLQTWLHEPVSKEQVRNELLLKLYFGPSSDVKSVLAQIEAFEAIQKAMKHQFNFSESVIEEQDASDLQKDYWRLTLLSGQLVNQARIKWCREVKKVLEKHVEQESRE